jgi:hypothetical protein
MSREHEEMLARVRTSDRMHCEADLYWRANRWVEDGRNMPEAPSYRTRVEAEHHLFLRGFEWRQIGQIWVRGDERAVVKESDGHWHIDRWWYD